MSKKKKRKKKQAARKRSAIEKRPASKKAAPGGKGRKPTAKKPAESIPKLPPLGAMEAEMAKIHRLLEDKDFESDGEAQAFLDGIVKSGGIIPDVEPTTPIDEAQEIIYDAWRASGREKVRLARQALEVCPDCADAYGMLARETAGPPMKALALYREAVEAGERALGPEYFEEDVGHFWGIFETRPYMRARLDLALSLWKLGQHEEAVSHLQEMLRLNPGDNQGIRYILAARLLMMDRDEELGELLDSYGDEPTACWIYTRALLSFRGEGDTGASRRLLKEALDRNPHVPDYFLGKRQLPDEPLEAIRFGDETEAIDDAFNFLPCWQKTSGALDWLEDVAG